MKDQPETVDINLNYQKSDWNIADDPFTIWGQNFIMICL